MTAKEYLQQARHLEQVMQCDRKAMEDLAVLTTCIPALDYSRVKVTSSGLASNANFTYLVEKRIELEGKIRRSLEESLRLKLEIRSQLEKVFPLEQRLVLEYRYLQALKWEEIQEKLGVSKRSAHRLHGLALQKISVQ